MLRTWTLLFLLLAVTNGVPIESCATPATQHECEAELLNRGQTNLAANMHYCIQCDRQEDRAVIACAPNMSSSSSYLKLQCWPTGTTVILPRGDTFSVGYTMGAFVPEGCNRVGMASCGYSQGSQKIGIFNVVI